MKDAALCIILLASALAGCSEPEGADILEDTAVPAPTECQTKPRVVSAFASGHYYRWPADMGASSGGRHIDLDWSWDVESLLRFEVLIEWDADAPTTETLRSEARLYAGTSFVDQPGYEGQSPLSFEVEVDHSRGLDETPILTLGAPSNPGQPASVSHTVIQQPVTVTIRETYRCSADFQA